MKKYENKTKNAPKKWTEEDIKILRDSYSKDMQIDDIVKLFNNGRTKKSIIWKAHKLGISSNRVIWVEEDVQFIRDNIERLTYREMEDVIGIAHFNIKTKAKSIGLSKLRMWTKAEEELLTKIYSTTDVHTLKEIFDCNAKRLSTKAGYLNLKKDFWWTDEETELVRLNYVENHLELRTLLPHRTRKSIEKKAYELGLKLTDEKLLSIRINNIQDNFKKSTENPNFKNDKDLRYTARNRVGVWRKAIIKRDKVCQLSGEREDLIVHHIKTFRNIYNSVLYEHVDNGFVVNMDLIKCIDINGIVEVESFLDDIVASHKLEDGILISRTLHDKFHNIYGTRECNEVDFNEFKENYKN